MLGNCQSVISLVRARKLRLFKLFFLGELNLLGITISFRFASVNQLRMFAKIKKKNTKVCLTGAQFSVSQLYYRINSNNVERRLCWSGDDILQIHLGFRGYK